MAYTRSTYPFAYGPGHGTDPSHLRPERWPAVDVVALMCQPGYLEPDDGRAVVALQVWLGESSLQPLVRGRTLWMPGNTAHLSHALGMFQLMRRWHVEDHAYPDLPPMTEAECLDPHTAWPRAWALMGKARPDSWHYNMAHWSAFTSGSYMRADYRRIAHDAMVAYVAGLE